MMSSVSSFAPGRVELLGNHTDYNGGVVLSAAINLGISARGRRRDGGQIVLSSEGLEGRVTARVDQLAASGSWADYPLGVAEILRAAGYPIGGFEADFSSTLPLGAGLSSSAAIEVCTGVLLMGLFDFSVPRLELARLCRRAENEFVGVSCGLLDQVSSIFGERHRAIHLDCRAETVETVPLPEGSALLVVNSGVKHALTGGEYNERRDQCFEAARILGVPALRDVSSAQLAAATMPDLVKRRAAHIVGENERVTAAVKHLRKGEAAEFGRLMTASHHSSMTNFENSTPELDALVEIAVALPGVHGARLTGGGFGGAIIALVEKDRIQDVADTIGRTYASRTGHQGTAILCESGPGALSA